MLGPANSTKLLESVHALAGHESVYDSFQDGVRATLLVAFEKDNRYTLFRSEDWPAWVTFTSVFIVLIVLDNAVMSRYRDTALTIGRAMLYTLFWVTCAGGFCSWVYWWYGADQAMMWATGYMLEWMLSFDNLFVFHAIFSVYGTPDHLKHRPLYMGICGAIFFRLAFIFVGEYLMHAMFFMHLVFGAFLIYTGFKTMLVDDDDEDPSQNAFVQWLQSKVPFVSAYDESGAFFVRVAVDDRGEVVMPEDEERKCRTALAAMGGKAINNEGAAEARYGTFNFVASQKGAFKKDMACQRGQMRGTMLLLVVCCLEVSDLLFAVDSVSAVVAQVPDLFLAYTSAVFAMLGLRAMFFIIDVLVKLFSMLKYGVGAVLIFIGVKLTVGRVYEIPSYIVCLVLVTAISSSMVASVVSDRMKASQKAPEDGVSPSA